MKNQFWRENCYFCDFRRSFKMTQKVAFEFLIFGLFHQCWMRLFLWFSNTVRTLFKIYKLLSKYSTFISWNNCRFFWGVKNRKNSWKCCGFGLLDFLAVNNFDFTRKIVNKNFRWKTRVKIEFLDKNLTFRIVWQR